jgi:signal transduction histidine kinase
LFDFQYLKGTTNQRDNNEKLTQVINNQFVNYLSYQPNRKAIWFEYILGKQRGLKYPIFKMKSIYFLHLLQ